MKLKENKVPMRYIGAIEVKIAGVGSILPGQTVEVPIRMANNLVRDPNWELSGPVKQMEISAPAENTEPVESGETPGLDGLDVSDNSDVSKEKTSKRKIKRQEES